MNDPNFKQLINQYMEENKLTEQMKLNMTDTDYSNLFLDCMSLKVNECDGEGR